MPKKLTPAQKAKRTRDAKKQANLDALGFERKKVKRRRKPMSEEQKKGGGSGKTCEGKRSTRCRWF